MDGLTDGDYVGLIAALVSAVAVIFSGYVNHELNLLRKDKERLWKHIGELRGTLSNTRENYVSKKDFDGAIGRVTVILDRIENRFITFAMEQENKNGWRISDRND